MTLLLIGRYPDLSAARLATLMHVHAGTMSGILKRLATAGFLSRTADADDGRRHVLRVTAKGMAANRQRRGTFEDTVRGLLRTNRPADIVATERVLTALAARLQETADAGES
jgi:DNA-binding MarR family transcriptional regulator